MSAETPAQLHAGALQGTVRLDLSAGLTGVPEEVLALADSLEILNLSGNQLSSLPDWLPDLKKLRVLFCSNNPFTTVPEVLGSCQALDMIGFKSCQIETLSPAALPARLRWLILTDNRLEELPAELGGCHRLQKLMLSGNRLTTLPDRLAQCRKLELLRLASNRFTVFPDWLLDLPSLAWLAVAGNACTALPDVSPVEGTVIDWADLAIGPLLGEGASGLIHQADWQAAPGEAPRAVAVKFFKGAMTSDGLPASEMAACLAVGAHPQLIGAHGRFTGHPDGLEGLVMPLVDPAWVPLAGPPSLESCTRDVYPAALKFSAAEALALIRNLAGAAGHLHGRGVLHGDLYAHNVMHQPGGQAVLGDFGAASFYPPGPAEKIERIEVRAFGILLEEILGRCTQPDLIPAALTLLAASCLRPAVASRPDFRGILAVVASL